MTHDLPPDQFDKYLRHAEFLLDRGYPVPTTDPIELAELIYKKTQKKEAES